MKIGCKDANKVTEQLLKFTKTYQENYQKDRYFCEARCIREQIPLYFDKWEPFDWFAGRASFGAIGFSPQVYTKRSGFGYFVEEDEIRSLQSSSGIKKKYIDVLENLMHFWKKRDSVNLTRKHYPDWVKNILPGDEWTGESGIAFPLYRMAGTQMDYGKLSEYGISGLKNEILNRDEKSKLGNSAGRLYNSMIYALDTFTVLCDSYIDHIKERDVKDSETRKAEMIVDSLEKIKTRKPENFHQAIQLFYLYNVLSGSQNYGRMDDFLGEFLLKDLESGQLTRDEALEYLVSLFQIMESRGTVYDGRAIVGGKGRKNEKAADVFALMAMQAINKSSTVLPQLTLRFYQGQNPELYKSAMDTIGIGCVYPMLYNDDVNIPSVAKAFGFTETEAEQYLPYGCGEYTLYHRSVDTPNGIINLAKALEIIIHEGTDPLSGKLMGIDINSDKIKNFEELIQLYKKQIEKHLDALAYQQRLEYRVAANLSPFLYFSMLYDSCIERGKPIFDGGVDYPGGTMETYGNTVAVDSLFAIKKTVFDDKIFSLEQLSYMLIEDFEGFEKERQLLKSLPKYGNDHNEVDNLYCELHDHICRYTRSLAEKNDLHHYLVVVINNDANTDLGFHTGASADGRKSGKSLNNGNAPSPGNDREGLTAFLNSIVKPRIDIHAGAVQNIKFSKKLFSDKPEIVKAALNTYFKKGGAQAMITVVGRNELEQAMKHPENYRNLMVRVGGFSARFVELRKEVQMEILERTIY